MAADTPTRLCSRPSSPTPEGPRIIAAAVLDDISPAFLQPALGFDQNPADLRLYHFGEAIMPVEFSVAAYRLGHSMVRPGYRVNESSGRGSGSSISASDVLERRASDRPWKTKSSAAR